METDVINRLKCANDVEHLRLFHIYLDHSCTEFIRRDIIKACQLLRAASSFAPLDIFGYWIVRMPFPSLQLLTFFDL